MAEHFTYRVSRSEEDGEHVGTCLEFPSLSHLADDPEAALHGASWSPMSSPNYAPTTSRYHSRSPIP
jgi:hypothetical protein